MNYKQLSTRGMQAFGAAIISSYCASKKVYDASVLALVEHLLTVLVVDNLPSWEQAGAGLELAGRGDPLPAAIASGLSKPERVCFEELVESAVEIGLCDMYSANTQNPERFLRKCIDLLEAERLSIPKLEYVFGDLRAVSGVGWGDPVDEAVYANARSWCLRMFSDG